MTDIDALRNVIAQRRIRRDLPSPAKRRRIRERAGVSQADLAKVLGVTVPAVSRWENGTRIPRGANLCERYLRALELMELEAVS